MTAEAVFSYKMAYCEEMVLRISVYFDGRGLPCCLQANDGEHMFYAE